MTNNDYRNLLCWSCRKARRSNGKIFCTTIGAPEMVMRYGNRCRRYEQKHMISPRQKQPSLFAEEEESTTDQSNELSSTPDVCPRCIYFVPGNDNAPDICFAEPTTADLGTDSNGVIRYCRLFKPTN